LLNVAPGLAGVLSNHAGGNGPGFRTQLLLFLDDLMPSVFGKPLLTGAAPDRRQITR
jgi:hypothetical protein